MGLDPFRQVRVVAGYQRRHIGDGRRQAGGDALGDLGLAGPGAAQHQSDHLASAQRRLPSSTARCAARASRDPQRERGPANASAGPAAGHRTATASEGVPVPANAGLPQGLRLGLGDRHDRVDERGRAEAPVQHGDDVHRAGEASRAGGRGPGVGRRGIRGRRGPGRVGDPHRGRGHDAVRAARADQAHVNGGQHADPRPGKFQPAGQLGQVAGRVRPAVVAGDLGGQDPAPLAPAATVRC